MAVGVVRHHAIEWLLRPRRQPHHAVPVRHVHLRSALPPKDGRAEAELAMPEHLPDTVGDVGPISLELALGGVGLDVGPRTPEQPGRSVAALELQL